MMNPWITKSINEQFDEAQIMKVVHFFSRAMDRLDAESIRSCFHPDGIDDHGMFTGPVNEFVPWVITELKKYQRTQHHITTQNVKINGIKAGCESYFYAHHVIPTPDDDMQMIVSGRYLDAMEKREGIWKITRRSCIVDWTDMRPINELPKPDGMTIYSGLRDTSDMSHGFFEKI